MRSTFFALSFACLNSLFLPPQIQAEVLATTHKDFSNTAQGAGGFSWGYYDAANSLTSPFLTTGMTTGSEPIIGPLWSGPDGASGPSWSYQQGHPGINVLRPAVARYTVGADPEPDHTGPLRLVGRFFDINTGDTEAFISVDADGEAAGSSRAQIALAQPAEMDSLYSVRGPTGAVSFDITLPSVAPDTTIDFGIYAGSSPNSDATGLVAWLVTGDTAVPTHILASNYSSIPWPFSNGATDVRNLAFAVATNGQVSETDHGSFDTTPPTTYAHAGLLYLEQPGSGKVTRFDSVRLDVTSTGDFAFTPQIYLLKHNSDPNTLNPSQDERYAPIPATAVRHEANSAGQPYYTFDLTSLPETQRTGYGFAVFGKGALSGGAIAVSEISAEATRVSDAGYVQASPAWIERNGHRYALTFTRGTWEQCQAEAVSYGGHLVALNSADENQWVIDTFVAGSENLFIGLRQNVAPPNVEPRGGWHWVDETNTPLNDATGTELPGVFHSWERSVANEPNHAFGAGEDYGMIAPLAFSGRKTWGDVKDAGFPETSNYRGIIELPSAGAPGGLRNQQLTVSGKANIFGAGQANPTPSRDAGSGGVAAPYATVYAGESFSITAASGSISTGAETSGPDGTHHATKHCNIYGVGGVSGYLNRNNSAHLVGVFVAETPMVQTPPRIDFSTAAVGEDFIELGPQLGQVFFIGDGLSPYGEVQKFIAPPGATRLYLGIPDAYEGDNTVVYTGSPNGYSDNSGAFLVRFAVTPSLVPQFLDTRFPLSGNTFAIAGGQPPYEPVSYSSGNLPPNVQIDGLGRVQGRPTEEGFYTVTVRTQDSLNVPGIGTFALSVAGAPRGMTAWWTADDNLLDSGGTNTHTATIHGNGNLVPGGLVGAGTFVFDGDNDYLSVAANPVLNLQGDFSIETWVKLNNYRPVEGSTLIAKRSADDREAYCLWVRPDGTLSFASRALDTQGRDWTETITPAGVTVPANGQWQHIAVTCTVSKVKLYINGVLVHSGAHPPRPATTEPMTIGASLSNGSILGDWNGAIDELALYNRAMTASEVRSIYDAYGLGKVIRTKPSLTDDSFRFTGGQLAIEGGTGPFEVEVVDGELPQGLTLSNTGEVTGVPVNGSYLFTLRVTDSLGRWSERSYGGVLELPVLVAPGVISWWPGDNTIADIVGGDHAPATANNPTYTKGKVGQAFHFNGVDQSLETSEPAHNMNHLPLTVEAWVKPEMHSSGSIHDPLPPNVICNDTPLLGGHGFGVHVYPNGSKLNVGVQGTDVDFRTAPGVTFAPDQWAHVAVVYTEGNVKIYVNGQQVDDFNYTQDELESSSIVRIGRHNDDTGYGTRRFFKGAIDEVSLYHAALTATQIQSIVGASSAGKARDDGGLQFSENDPQIEGDLWTYGAIDNPNSAGGLLSSSFDLYPTLLQNLDGGAFWLSPNGGVAGANTSDELIVERAAASYVYTLPRQLRLHPGTDGRPSVVRWTAPADGRYAVSGAICSLDNASGATTSLDIYHNGDPMAQVSGDPAHAEINGGLLGNDKPLTGLIDVEAGDTVDFIVGPRNGYSFDSTGLFASVASLGASLEPVANLAIDTQLPPLSDRFWEFRTFFPNDIPGLSLRVQYSEANTPSDWHDIDLEGGTNEMTPPAGDGDPWILPVASLNLPVGNYKFRVVATALGYTEEPSQAFGMDALGEEGSTEYIALSVPGQPPPPAVPLAMPAATKVTYTLGGKANATTVRQGVEAVFTITQPVPKGIPEPELEVQWTTDKTNESSWDDLSGTTITMTKPPATIRTVTIRSSRLPSGSGIYFRVLTKGKQRQSTAGPIPKLNDPIKFIGPINITPGVTWNVFRVTNSTNNTSDSSGDIANVGERITYQMHIVNGGAANATNVVASMTAPTGTRIVGGTSQDLSVVYSQHIRTLTWKLSSLPPDAEVVKELVVEVTTTGNLVSFPQTAATLKCTEIPVSPKPMMESSNTRTKLDTIVQSTLRLRLSASPRSPRMGETVDFDLYAENTGTTAITSAYVTFKVPLGMHVEYLRLPDSNNNFTDVKLENPSPTSNPSLTPYEYLGQQSIRWNLGTVPGTTTRHIRFTLRVMHDLDPMRMENGVWVTNQLFANDFNFFGKRGAASLKAFTTVPETAFNLSAAATSERPPRLLLHKTVAADGRVQAPAPPATILPPATDLTTPADRALLRRIDMPGVGYVAAPLKGTRLTYKLKWSNSYYPTPPPAHLRPPGYVVDNRPPATARNVVLHDEIPSGTTFAGFIRKNGVLLSSDLGFTFRDKSGKVIASNSPRFTETRYIDVALGMLPAGDGGEITYDVIATGLEGNSIVSRSDGAIIPNPSGGMTYEGFSIWCENRLRAGEVTPVKLTSMIARPVTIERPYIWVDNPQPARDQTVNMEIAYAVEGVPLSTQNDFIMTVTVPKPLTVEIGRIGQVNTTVPKSQDLRPLKIPAFNSALGESYSIVNRTTDTQIIFRLGGLSAARNGVLAAQVKLPQTLPASMFTATGTLKSTLDIKAEMSHKKVGTVTVTPASDIVVLDPWITPAPASSAFTRVAAAATPPLESLIKPSTKLFVGRTYPFSAKPGTLFNMIVFFGNATYRHTQGGMVTMKVPPGLTLQSQSAVKYYYTGVTPAGDNTYERDNVAALKTVNGHTYFTIETLDLAPHTMGAVILDFKVADNIQGNVIEDNSLQISTPLCTSKFAPKMIIDVERENPIGWLFGCVGRYLTNIFNGATPEVNNALAPYASTFTSRSRHLDTSNADFVQVLNGSIVIPLQGDRTAVVGTRGAVEVASGAEGNILQDDGEALVVVTHKSVASVKVVNIKAPNWFAPVQMHPEDILRGIVMDTGLNLVAAGAGNLVAAGGGNLVAAGGGNLVAAGGGNLISNSNGALGRSISFTNNNLVAAGGGNLVAAGGGNMVAAGGGNLIGNDGATFIGLDGGTLLAVGTNRLVAAGGGNLVAAGGGNLVAAGGGNFVEAAGGKIAAGAAGAMFSANASSILAGRMAGVGLMENITRGPAMGILSHNGGQILSHNGGLFTAP